MTIDVTPENKDSHRQDSSKSNSSTEKSPEGGQTSEELGYEVAKAYEHKIETMADENARMETDAVNRDEEISACFERARENLNGLLRSKKQVIRDLAHELERLGRPVDHIAAEIIHELRECEELSKSLIYSYLDEKYKDPSHASRRKGKKTKNLVPETGTESATEEDQAELAAEQEALLKREILVQADTSGHSIQQKQPTARAEMQQQPYHTTESGIDIHPDTSGSKPDSAKITQQQEETSSPLGIDANGQQEQKPVCKHCPAKDAKIMELGAKIKELEQALAVTSMKSAEELMHRSTDSYKQFEFCVPTEPLRRHIVYFNGINGAIPDRVWFNGKFNHKTGEVVDVRMGKTIGTDSTDVSRMTP